jgi:hypothetical protein
MLGLPKENRSDVQRGLLGGLMAAKKKTKASKSKAGAAKRARRHEQAARASTGKKAEGHKMIAAGYRKLAG